MACLVLCGATVPFNELVSGIDEGVVGALARVGITQVDIQFGHAAGAFAEGPGRLANVTGFGFDPELEARIKAARLVISHAGTGSILDTLRGNPGVPLIVVVNDGLMDNHQLEVANELAPRYLLVSAVGDLARTVGEAAGTQFEVLPPPARLDAVISEVLHT